MEGTLRALLNHDRGGEFRRGADGDQGRSATCGAFPIPLGRRHRAPRRTGTWRPGSPKGIGGNPRAARFHRAAAHQGAGRAMTDRRYDDKEIAAIFRAATEGPLSPQRQVPPEEGLTLADLQAIGREVGISPAAVAQAARALDIRRETAARTFFGLPIGVARTVNLN